VRCQSASHQLLRRQLAAAADMVTVGSLVLGCCWYATPIICLQACQSWVYIMPSEAEAAIWVPMHMAGEYMHAHE
jgi:hypothetical protein